MGKRATREPKAFTNNKIGQILRERRKQMGLSQKDVANQVNVNHTTISRIERDEFNGKFYKLLHIASVLGLSVTVELDKSIKEK